MALKSSIGTVQTYQDMANQAMPTSPVGTTFVDQSQQLYWAWIAPTTSPTTQTQQLYGTPKVATSTAPVISRDTPKLPQTTPDISDIQNMNLQQINEYITRAQVYGVDQANKDEQYRLSIAGQRAQQLAMPQTPTLEQTDREATLERIKREDFMRQQYQLEAQAMSEQEKLLNAQYQQRATELQKAGEQQMGAAQGVLSFSWFGRSTFAAEKMAEIQGAYNAQKDILAQERDIALQRFKAEQEGAKAEQLAAYDQYMAALKQKEQEYLIQTAEKVNEYNAQYAQSLQEKIDNIFQTSMIYDDTQLTPDEVGLVDAYSQFLIDDKGNINDSFLKQIPAKLVWATLKRAANLQKDRIQQWAWFDFKVIGNTLARIDTSTWEVEFLTWGQADLALSQLAPWTPVEQWNRSEVITADTDLSTIPDLVQQANARQEASIKNNNPSGITAGFSPRLRQKLLDAWINFIVGSWRPSDEGGNYVKFAKVGDWLKAHYIILSQTGRDDVYDRLYAWSAGWNKNTPEPQKLANKRKYAQDLLNQAWIKKWTKFSELNNDQIDKLVQAHINKESPLFAEAVFAQPKAQQSPEKEAYLELIKRWWLTNTDKMAVLETAKKEWWLNEYNDALKQWVKVDLTPTQQTQYNKEYDRFVQNAVVKWFEEQLSQFQWLWYALSDRSWPWDMAWVFGFMKTLDPTSVVREAEFETAAWSAWLASRRKNIYNKLNEWKILTAEQADDFKRIAKFYIESKAISYDRKYNDMINAFEKFGIDRWLAPAKATDQLREYLKWTQQPNTASVNLNKEDESILLLFKD